MVDNTCSEGKYNGNQFIYFSYSSQYLNVPIVCQSNERKENEWHFCFMQRIVIQHNSIFLNFRYKKWTQP